MKQLIFIFSFFSCVFGVQAQQVNNIALEELPEKYIEVSLKSAGFLSGKAHLHINYGQASDFNLKRSNELTVLKDENNQPIRFDAVIGAINFLAKHGFKLIESYQNISTSSDNELDVNSRIYILENLNYKQ